MISGALFLDREISVKTLYRKYILRIVILYFVWSFLYALVYQLIEEQNVNDFITSIFTGHYHMWFLLMIIGMYSIVPFLRKIVQDEKLMRYFLILGVFFALILPEMISVMKVFAFSQEAGSIAQTMLNNSYFHFVLGFPVYFVGGYFLSKQSFSKKQEKRINFLGILGFLSTILLTSTVSLWKGRPITVFYLNQTFNVALESVLVFLLFKKVFSQKHFSPKSGKWISLLSQYTLGAYLVHAFIITGFLNHFQLSSASFNALFSIPLVTLLVFLVSFGISALLHQIPFVKDHLV